MMYKPYETTFRNQTLTIREKLANLSFTYLLLIITLAAIGVIMLYSAANGNWQPWAVNQLVRFTIGFGLMLFLALIDIRWLMRYAYLFLFRDAGAAGDCRYYRAYRHGGAALD